MTILFLLPLILYTLFFIFILIQGLSINFIMFIISAILLLITGLGLNSKNKYLQLIGIICLLVFTIWYFINGYSDYLKWTSSVIGIINLIYFIIIYFIKKKTK